MRFKDTGDVVVISEADAQKLIDQARPHWRLPLRILYYYGMRASELLSLTSNNFRDGVFVLQRTKRGELTRQAIHPSIKEDLHALMKTKLPGALLFPYSRISLYRQMQEAGHRAGVDPAYCHPHSFRHCAGRRWAKIGTPYQVQAMLGHKTLAMALLYGRLACDEDMSRKFLE